MNGSGIKRSSASPTATVAPEKITARPAVSIVRSTAASTSWPRVVSRSSGLRPARELLSEAIDDQQRVVDRDPDPDQEDQVRDVGRHRHVVGDDVDDSERPED